MADFPYVLVTGNLKRFLSHIQTAGVPGKVTTKYLPKVGFKSTNDRAIVSVLKFIGFIDAEGTPTDRWSSYRNRAAAGKVMADAVREAYSDLFEIFPDADRKDNEALRDFFSAHTRLGAKALGAIASTFKALCELGDFESTYSPKLPPTRGKKGAEVVQSALPATPAPDPPAGPSVNINIQLELPATEDATVYEKLFSAMKKHLFQK